MKDIELKKLEENSLKEKESLNKTIEELKLSMLSHEKQKLEKDQTISIQLQNEIEGLKQTLDEKNILLNQLSEQIKDTNKKIENNENQLQTLQNEKKSLLTENQNLLKQKNDIELKSVSETKKLSENLKKINDENQILKEKVINLEKTISKQQQNLHDANISIASLEEKCGSLKIKISQYQTTDVEIKELKSLIEEMSQKEKEWIIQYNNIETEKNKEIEKYKMLLERANFELHQKEVQNVKEFERSKQERSDEIEKLYLLMEDMKSEIKNKQNYFEREQENKVNEIVRLNMLVEEVKNQVLEKDKLLSKQNDNYSKALIDEEIKKITLFVNEIQTNMVKQKEMYEKLIIEKIEKINELVVLLGQTKNKIKEEKEILNQKLEQMKLNNINEIEKLAKSFEETNSLLKTREIELNNEIKKLENDHKNEMLQAKILIDQSKTELNEQNEKQKKEKEEFLSFKNEKQKEVNSLKQQLTLAQHRSSTSTQSLNNLAALQQKVARLEEDNEKLRLLTHPMSESAKKFEMVKEINSELTKKLNEKKEEIESLNKKVHSLELEKMGRSDEVVRIKDEEIMALKEKVLNLQNSFHKDQQYSLSMFRGISILQESVQKLDRRTECAFEKFNANVHQSHHQTFN
eukprot:c21913_g1_i3.p1 GENE.c21913_g1_i3~~c21913_g1_i3.p1  ORF type:complete len:658 (+),score=269.33 c21913_g1_i3:73-1974(+)